ncbi:MAG: trypsin-like serine peptidase [Planctomycetota bacterium]
MKTRRPRIAGDATCAARTVVVALVAVLLATAGRAAAQCQPACGKQNIECLNPGPEYNNRTAVGYVTTPTGGCCTGWIIAEPNFILTNRHCITTDGSSTGPLGDVTTMTIQFNRECDACVGGAATGTTTIAVTGLVHENASLDYAILTTAGNPAATWGVLRIDPSPPVVGEAVYEIHHGGCARKGYDDGQVTTPVGSGLCIGSTTAEFGVDLIATGGASGSPIFRESNHCVMGICHCGPACAPGFGVPMSAIWPDAQPEILAAGGVPHLCVCGDPSAGSCFASNGSAGCSNADCCNLVCSVDDFCCNTIWDTLCANQAVDLCSDCGEPAAGDCFASNGSPSCDDATCCAIVCAIDSFCCHNNWDSLCASAARANCDPPNDDCVDAIPVVDGDSVIGNVAPATNDGTSTCGGGTNRDVWYTFTAPCTGILAVNTCGTHDTPSVDNGMDSLISMHSACPGTALNSMTCDDNAGPPPCPSGDTGLLRDASISHFLTPGQQVWIRVTHSGPIADGEFVLNVDFRPINDACSQADAIFNGATDFCNVGATTDGPVCAGMSNDIWYRYTAPFTGDVTVSTCGSSFDTVLAVYDGCACPPGTQLACNDQFACDGSPSNQSQVTVPVVSGQCYLIQVGGWSGNSGSGTILISKDFAGCGSPAAGSCFAVNGSPACEDETCCNVVCAVDSYCCNTTWDSLCAAEAAQFCVNPCPGDCADGGNGAVDVSDLLRVLAQWSAGPAPGVECDVDNGTMLGVPDNVTNVSDLLFVLARWGPCPPADCDDCADGSVDACGPPDGGIGIGCFECITPDGGCLCVANDFCVNYEPCVDGECPPGFACCVNTCCGTPVCVPVCDFTPPAAAAPEAGPRPELTAPTGSRAVPPK